MICDRVHPPDTARAGEGSWFLQACRLGGRGAAGYVTFKDTPTTNEFQVQLKPRRRLLGPPLPPLPIQPGACLTARAPVEVTEDSVHLRLVYGERPVNGDSNQAPDGRGRRRLGSYLPK